jgi:hypothetical protein
MIYRFLFVLLILSAAGCVQPVFDTPTAAPSPSPTPSATVAPSDTPTKTVTPSSTWTATYTDTATLTHTPTSSPTASRTPRPTFTAGPTLTSDQVNMNFPATITVTFDPTNPAQHCFLTFYDVTLEPGFLGVWRRDKGGYFNCVKGE